MFFSFCMCVLLETESTVHLFIYSNHNNTVRFLITDSFLFFCHLQFLLLLLLLFCLLALISSFLFRWTFFSVSDQFLRSKKFSQLNACEFLSFPFCLLVGFFFLFHLSSGLCMRLIVYVVAGIYSWLFCEQFCDKKKRKIREEEEKNCLPFFHFTDLSLVHRRIC